MNWKEIKDIAWFIFFATLAIALIENDGITFLVEMAGDVLGVLTIAFLTAERALQE
jgi:hypothetical protein